MAGPRIAWITGGGKGIGAAVARRLAADGWTVAISARQVSDRDAGDLAGGTGRVAAYPLDVTDAAAAAAVVAQIERELGPIDLAILNAGTHTPVSGLEFDLSAVRRIVETNLMGTANSLAAVMPAMVARRRGEIAIVGSVAGYVGLPTSAAYGATKAGLANFAEAIKPELERAGVRMRLISPGFVDTPLTRKNKFPMPFLIPAERAAEIIVRGLEGRRFEIVFPWRMAVAMKLLRRLPYPALFAITRRLVPRRR